MISYKLRGVIYITGNGCNGKNTLIRLLRSVVRNSNNIKPNIIVVSNMIDPTMYRCMHERQIADVLYCIFENNIPHDISNVESLKYKAYSHPGYAIIIITNYMLNVSNNDRVINMINNIALFGNAMARIHDEINLNDLKQYILNFIKNVNLMIYVIFCNHAANSNRLAQNTEYIM